jgi:hypothetical protein
MQPTAVASLTDRFRRLLEAVKGSFGLERRRGLLAGPMTLLLWLRTRWMRREIEAAATQFVRLMEQFLALLEDYRAGKLPAPPTPEVGEAREAAEAKPGRTEPSPLRSRAGLPPDLIRGEGPAKREGEVYSRERSFPESAEPARDRGLRRCSAASSRLRSAPAYSPPRPAPSWRARVTPRVLAPRARPPPGGHMFAGNSPKGLAQAQETRVQFIATSYRTVKPHCHAPIDGRGSPRFSRNVAPPYSR